jgi:ATP-dependent DNA helicase PIF1
VWSHIQPRVVLHCSSNPHCQGIAAVHIGGTTLHSFAGCGLGEQSAEQLAANVKRNKASCQRWEQAKFLLIDEISMLDGELFDKLEHVARIVRRSKQPFGGMQLVLCGDFFQLPPVGKSQFCFEATSWSSCVDVVVVLKQIFRQSDAAFVRLLSEARIGQLSSASVALLRGRLNAKLNTSDHIEPTILFPYKQDVAAFNSERLGRLAHTPEVVIHAVDNHKGQQFLDQLDKHCQAPKTLVLKAGAQVLLVKNLTLKTYSGDPIIREQYVYMVNGQRGRITSFVTRDKEMLPKVLFFVVGQRGVPA